MHISGIIGHKEVLKALETALRTNKVGHAYLFIGPSGVGKKTLAKALAGRLLCLNQQDEGCDCQACRYFRSGTHPEFITIKPNGNSIKIEQLRELQRTAYLRPLLGERKVIFFPDAEQLTEAAANSFLKLLEEPPPATVFLFTAVRAERILATIRSRCQIMHLFPVPLAEIEIWLQNLGFDPEEATKRATASAGIPGMALRDASQTDDSGCRFIELLETDLLELLKVANDLERKERSEVITLLRQWEEQARDELLRLEQDQRPGPGRPNPAILAGILPELSQVIRMVESNTNIRLAIEYFLLYSKRRIHFS